MPYYDYKCTSCGHEFEDFKEISRRDEDSLCPLCKRKAKRMITSPSVVFHGSGFYVTDHRAKAAKA